MEDVQKQAAVPQWSLQDRLRKSLDHAELTPEEMATRLYVHANTVRNWLKGPGKRGGTQIDRRTITLWAEHTGVSAAWLTDGDDGNASTNSAGVEPISPAGTGNVSPSLHTGVRPPRGSVPDASHVVDEDDTQG